MIATTDAVIAEIARNVTTVPDTVIEASLIALPGRAPEIVLLKFRCPDLLVVIKSLLVKVPGLTRRNFVDDPVAERVLGVVLQSGTWGTVGTGGRAPLDGTDESEVRNVATDDGDIGCVAGGTVALLVGVFAR